MTLTSPVPFDADTLTTQTKPKCVLAWAPHIHMDFCECPECSARKECKRLQDVHTARPSRENLDRLNAAYAELPGE